MWRVSLCHNNNFHRGNFLPRRVFHEEETWDICGGRGCLKHKFPRGTVFHGDFSRGGNVGHNGGGHCTSKHKFYRIAFHGGRNIHDSLVVHGRGGATKNHKIYMHHLYSTPIRGWPHQGQWKWYHSKAWYSFLFDFRSNYGCICNRFDTTRTWHSHSNTDTTPQHMLHYASCNLSVVVWQKSLVSKNYNF